MPFRYRLQKILEFRIRKKEEQEAVVQKAQQAVHQAEMDIKQNEDEIMQTVQAKKMADYRMMEYYDKYLHHLWDKAEELEKKREEAQKVLDEEMEKCKGRIDAFNNKYVNFEGPNSCERTIHSRRKSCRIKNVF